MKKPHPSGIRGAPTCFCEHVGLSAFSAEAGDTLSAQANGRRTTRVLGRDKSLTCSPGGRPLLPTPPLPSVRTAETLAPWLSREHPRACERKQVNEKIVLLQITIKPSTFANSTFPSFSRRT